MPRKDIFDSPSFNVRRTVMVGLGLALVSTTMGLVGCATAGNKEKGGVIGAAAGGAIGGVIGKNNGSTAKGVLIGAVIGGTAGAVIGHQMDQQAKELKVEIPGATVERVGEGIQVTFASGLLYDFDSDAVRAAGAENLRNLAASLKKYDNTDLLIVGHTDAAGTTDYNQDLSVRRARSAANYLTAQGVGAPRLRTTGKGEGEPVATNDTESGRQLNRRVEVAIYASDKARSSR